MTMQPRWPAGLAAAICTAGAAMFGGPVQAQDTVSAAGGGLAAPPPTAAPSTEPAPSEVMALNLIHLLVKQGVISQQAADAVIQEAAAETKLAQQAAAAREGSGSALASAAPAPPGVLRIPYVPEVVRNQIRDDVKKDVMAQAQAEGWANPNVAPPWLDHITFFGDLRFQDQLNFYQKDNISPYIDFATFNNNGPIDVNATTNPAGLPFLNTRTDRLNQLIIRARFGATYKVDDNVAMTVRLATSC